MAAGPHGIPTYPVWVGSLKETIKDSDLKHVFSKFGAIANCKIMRDEQGKSKKFGYVNFYKLEEAEAAAEKCAGFQIGGVSIKTKGPSLLKQQGHWVHTTSPDFRPVIDCSFFIQGVKCKKGKSCTYRHSEAARSNPEVCVAWMERRCTNTNCPRRHPGGQGKSDSPGIPLDADYCGDGSPELFKCGGRCGDYTCAAHFPSTDTLTQHIKLAKLPHCRYCAAIFMSEREYQTHKRVCRARRESGSTESQSEESADIEFLSETESEASTTGDSETGENRPLGLPHHLRAGITPSKTPPATKRGSTMNPSKTAPATKRGSITGMQDKTPPAAKRGSIAGMQDKTPPATKRGSIAGMQGKTAPATKRGSIAGMQEKTPPAVKRGSVSKTPVPSAGKRGSVSSGGKRSRSTSAASIETGAILSNGQGLVGYSRFPPSGTSSDTETDEEEEFEGSDYRNSDDDENDVISYSKVEMARLLSLNEHDMYDSSSEESESEEEDSSGGEMDYDAFLPGDQNGSDLRCEYLPEDEVVKKKPRRRRRKQKEDTPPAAAKPRSQSEPVGVFWDIENCSVPLDKSAFALANKIRRVFFEGKREAEFMCVCDVTKERKEVTDALHRAQVTLVHVNAIAKNAADDKLRQSLRRFAHTYPPPSTVVLISGDVNFSPELNDLRHIHNITIVLVHNQQASDALKVFANRLISFDKFLEDVEAPMEPQRSSLPKVVIVSNLPSHMPPNRVSSRLDQLSDNCGGRVLSVHPPSGTAKILFRSPDWAMKAQKRMNGEDVYGFKITCTLDRQAPPEDKKFKRLTGTNLSKTFPPGTQQPPRRPSQPPTSPPLPAQPYHYPGGPPMPPQQRPLLHPLPPLMAPQFRPPLLGPSPHSPPLRGPPPQGPPLYGPPPHSPPLRGPPPHSPPLRGPPPQGPPYRGPPPRGPPPNGPYPPLAPAAMGPTVLQYSQVLQKPHPSIEGKILLFKIPPIPGSDISQLNGHVVSIRLSASVKAENVILWHSFSEMQVLLRVDFLQTAIVRNEEMIKTLYERGELRPQLAQAFVERCAASISDVCRREKVPWDVTVCGWNEDEELDRITRSEVIGLLRACPFYWAKWNNFKEKFSKSYDSAISEMAIHTACSGAVQILGNPSNEPTQVIVFKELSPLIRVNDMAQAAVQKSVIKLLSAQPEKKIRLLDIVRSYQESFGPLPLTSKGKPFQDMLRAIPNVNLVGNKPSSIFVTLTKPGTRQVPAPKTLAEIAADFRKLLRQYPQSGLPLSNIQQEYQTFYHRSFRVSDYIQKEGGTRMRDLLEACEGVKLKDAQLPSGKMDTIVYVETEPPVRSAPPAQTTTSPPPVTTATVTAPAATTTTQTPAINSSPPTATVQQIPQESVERFKLECIEVLSGVPGHKLEVCRFTQVYHQHFGQQLVLAQYGAKKLMQIFQAIPKTVKVTDDASKMVELIVDTQVDCERRIEVLLYSLPDHHVSLDRFMYEYEKRFGEKLSSYYGHPKLVNLLEDMEDTVEVRGKGPARRVSLHPLRVFACEMVDLLTDHPDGLAISKIVPAYKEKFKKDLSVADLGFPKLIRVLEAIEDTVKLEGSGPGRVAHSRRGKVGQSAFTPASESQFRDEVTAILMSTQNLKMSIPQLTRMYNNAFRKSSGLLSVTYSELVEALSKNTTAFKLSGSGPTQYVQLIPQVEDSAKQKEGGGKSQPAAEPGMKTEKQQEATGKATDIQPKEEIKLLETATTSVVTVEPAKATPLPTTGWETPTKAAATLGEKEGKRISSETHRLLLSHQEHAMTLTELEECFRSGGDPASPSAEDLYICLKKYNAKTGAAAKQNNFQISYIPTSLGDSMVQLNQPDCVWKLSRDLLYLFSYHPTVDFTMPLDHLLITYAECYGHPFVPAVYAAKKIQTVMKSKHVAKIMTLDESGSRCVLTEQGRQSAFAMQAAELLFLRGEECTTIEDLPKVYQDHFGLPLQLSCFGVESVSALLGLPEVATVVEISDEGGNPKPVLSNSTRFAEQLRHLLTIHNGRIPLNQLEGIYASEFGDLKDVNMWLEKKLIHHAPHVVNLAGQRWAIWAPTGCPYPPRGTKVTFTDVIPSTNEAGSELPTDSFTRATVETATGGVTLPRTASSSSKKSSSAESDENLPDDDEIPPPEYEQLNTAPEGTEVTTDADVPLIDFSDPPLSPVAIDDLSPTTGDTSFPQGLEVPIDLSPYGFLERDLPPELLAELISNANELEDPEQQLIDLGPTVSTSSVEAEESLANDGGLAKESPGKLDLLSGEIDYSKMGMTPDEVLQEFHKVNLSSGGILNPEKLEPFLSYFGELSSRELERLEAQKPKSASKGASKRKRVMAIRFPGQSPPPPPDPFVEQYRKNMEVIKRNLPEAPDLTNLSDTSEEEEVKPFCREEYIKKVLDGGLSKVFDSSDEDSKTQATAVEKDKEESLTADTTPRPLCDNPNPATFPNPFGSDSSKFDSFSSPVSSAEPTDWPVLPGTMEYVQLQAREIEHEPPVPLALQPSKKSE